MFMCNSGLLLANKGPAHGLEAMGSLLRLLKHIHTAVSVNVNQHDYTHSTQLNCSA